MAKACLRDSAPFGVCLIRLGKEVGAPATPEEVGCLARIAHWDMPQLGLLEIVARGERRFRIRERRVQADGLARASVELLPPEDDAAVPENRRACTELLERLIAQQDSAFEQPHRLDSALWVSARLAEILPMPLAAKQAMLELDDGLSRLKVVFGCLARPGPARGR